MPIATSFGVLNYSGMLFNKGNTRTPLSAIIGARPKLTNHVEFVTGQEYEGGGAGSQPAITETASLTAPEPTVVTREQKTNDDPDSSMSLLASPTPRSPTWAL